MTYLDKLRIPGLRGQEMDQLDYFRSIGSIKSPIVQKAVVVDIIFDPSRLDEQAKWLGGEGEIDETTGKPMDTQKDRLNKGMTVKELLIGAPRNSIIVRPIARGADRMNFDAGILCYPLFPPHLCLPVKAGEQVLIIDPTPGELTDIMYWVCRAPEPNYVDDLNFTHGDRTIMESPLKMEFNPEEDEEDPNNYRAITVVDAISKVLAIMINE